MTADLVQFLRDRLGEDEQAARVAAPGPWAVDGGSVYVGHPINEVVDYSESAAHIARHDPARVLAEVEAKRAIVDWVEECRAFFWQTDGTLMPSAYRVLAPLAAIYADHLDFRDEWRS